MMPRLNLASYKVLMMAETCCRVKKGRVTKLKSADDDIISQCLGSINEGYIKVQLETAQLLKDNVGDLAPYQSIFGNGRRPKEEKEGEGDLCDRINMLSTSDGHKEHFKPSEQQSKSSPRKWQIGDICVCRWCEDNKWYFAEIIDITEDAGYCEVQFLYYGTEQYFVRLDRIHRVDGSSRKWVEDEDNARAAQELLKTVEIRSDGRSLPKVEPGLSVQSGAVMKRKGRGKTNSVEDKWKTGGGPVLSQFWRTLLLESYGNDENAVRNLLNSWYMCGYQTGYLTALKKGARECV
ncbi:hypothetical protein ECG_03866 [Echinococcus granulosus]|uniref:Survival motor neuron protein 1 n=1 Tax=Echinococcus granulosus TaxID=6210 RepID=A0A068WJJ8_ECHGR|nr:hypothetical protein ECG_03866 [Echinococcus granulosus]CDS17863.1 survival motor neuron protein 1 [Echinococcus granulosus]